MPSVPKFIKRRTSSFSLRKSSKKDEAEPPPVPALPQDGLPFPEKRPALIISSSFSDSPSNSGQTTPTARGLLTVDTTMSGDMKMWKAINDSQAGKNLSKSEKFVNKVSDVVNGAVTTTTNPNGVVSLVQTVVANEQVQAIGKTILDNVPAMMNALEALTDVHPFLKAAYLPFKLIYGQEIKRRENDRTRTSLFEKIKDVMMVLLELKDVGKNEARVTPDGENLLSRVETICNSMKDDIEKCYNVLNAQEKRSLAIKFLQAATWNNQLAGFAAKFQARRDELQFALQLRVAAGVDEIKQTVNEMRDMFFKMFSSYQTPQEREMGQWIEANGGESVLNDKEKWGMLIQKEDALSSATRRRNPGVAEVSIEVKVAALRKEYHEDVKTVIQENWEIYTKRFQMGMDQLNEDLSNKIAHQGDRIIGYLSGGPHKRIKDKIMYHIWKEQGWRGSAKTRPLVLALRDYFVERVERANSGEDSARPPPTPIQATDEPIDPEVAMGQPLPDSWMTEYLHVKRLRYVQQAFDNDASGFTTISEVNAFTRARPTDWSLPKWISYWAIGWQIFATKYCIEIEEIFVQMSLLREEIAVKMPGNKRYVNSYLNAVWGQVTTLVTAIERYPTAPAWLTEQFQSYAENQEKILHRRLQKINYDIDTLDTVNLIIGQEHIERVIFPVLALVLRRHLAKIHLCLRHEMNAEELEDDLGTVLWLSEAAWARYLALSDIFRHQQVADLKQTFAWFSCGLFKNYYEFGDWTNVSYYREHEIAAWAPSDQIRELEPSALENILIHDGPDDVLSDDEDHPPPRRQDSGEKVDVDEPLVYDMSGDWYGYQWKSGESRTPMLCITIESSYWVVDDTEETTHKKISFRGLNTTYEGTIFRVRGILFVPQSSSSEYFTIEFSRLHPEGGKEEFSGVLSPAQDIIANTDSEGEHFLFKRTSMPTVLCHRPLTMTLEPKQLWQFAYHTVADNLRRSQLASLYIFKRVLMVKRYLELLNRATDESERDELNRIKMSFTPDESREVFKLFQWYQRVGDVQRYLSCDSCGDDIHRSRVVCLDCLSDSSNSVDFCQKPACVDTKMIVARRTDVNHLPTHVMLKTRDAILLKDHYNLDLRARISLDSARTVYSQYDVEQPMEDDGSEEESESQIVENGTGEEASSDHEKEGSDDESAAQVGKVEGPKVGHEEVDPNVRDEVNVEIRPRLGCLICLKQVRVPCWYCVNCRDSDSFVCDDCEEVIDGLYPWDLQNRYRTEVANDKLAHNVYHVLVRFSLKEDDPSGEGDEFEKAVDHKEALSASQQWQEVQERIWLKMDEILSDRLAQLEDRVDQRIEKRMGDIEERLASRLSRIEEMLTPLLRPTP